MRVHVVHVDVGPRVQGRQAARRGGAPPGARVPDHHNGAAESRLGVLVLAVLGVHGVHPLLEAERPGQEFEVGGDVLDVEVGDNALLPRRTSSVSRRGLLTYSTDARTINGAPGPTRARRPRSGSMRRFETGGEPSCHSLRR